MGDVTMYRVIIEFKEDLPIEKMIELKQVAAGAFNNRAGTVQDRCPQNNMCIFEGAEDKYGCLGLGNLGLDKVHGIREQIKLWEWIDEEYPSENCSVLQEFIAFDNERRKIEYAER